MQDKIIEMIAPKDSKDWKCYDTLRMLLENNEDFRNIIIDGITNGLITGFNEELWEKIGKQNLMARGVDTFFEVLRDGYNQGYCTVASKQVSYSLNTCDICGGVVPILAGTTNCIDGSHTWIETNKQIIDTTFMLMIDKSLKSKIGYIEENRYNPNIDPIYCSAKEFANDKNLKCR